MRHVAFLLLLLLAPSLGFAANKTVKVRGVIGVCGTDECGIGGLSEGYSFVSHTKIANKILSVCGVGADCEITGTVDSDDFFVSLSNVRRIDIDVEPSVKVVVEAACNNSNIQCGDDPRGFYLDYIDVKSIRRLHRDNANIWHVVYDVCGVEHFKHFRIPGEMYLELSRGEWNFSNEIP